MDVIVPVAAASAYALDIIELIVGRKESAPVFASIYCLGGMWLLDRPQQTLFAITAAASIGTFSLLSRAQFTWGRPGWGVACVLAAFLLRK
jgi:hypothetical protein